MQRASISSARAVHSDNMDCMRQHCSAAACASSCKECKLKDQTTLQRNTRFAPGFLLCSPACCRQAKRGLPRSGVGECASLLFLQSRAHSERGTRFSAAVLVTAGPRSLVAAAALVAAALVAAAPRRRRSSSPPRSLARPISRASRAHAEWAE